MSESISKLSNEIDVLSSSLLSTLDESIFFTELSTFFSKYMVPCDKMHVFQVQEDTSAKLISQNGKAVEDGRELIIGEGPAGHVIRTKRPYFSNNVSRDPIFSQEASEGVIAELCIPVTQEGILIATMHFQSFNEGFEYRRENIVEILAILNELKKPLANMKMYLAAKSLNETLIKKIEAKEKELEERTKGLQISDSFKVVEKDIIGKSDIMIRLLGLSDRLAESHINVLLTGENGTGKELVARRIHCRSNRKDRPFITLDCSSMSEIQLETELFGQGAGMFENGRLEKRGILESANGGTVLLKKIETLPLGIQSKLYHFLSEGIAFKLGEQIPYRSDVRIIASTPINLSDKVESNEFREDLYYALNTMSLAVPALRDRKEDIELLANTFLNGNKPVEKQKSFSPCVIKSLLEYSWPGNIRELQNIIERAYILADGMIIEKSHLADCVHASVAVEAEPEVQEIDFTEMTLDELERHHICNTLDYLSGNKTKTAKMLGITVKTLYNKLHSYGMIQQKDS